MEQPDLAEEDEAIINQDIVKLEKALYEQVYIEIIFHVNYFIKSISLTLNLVHSYICIPYFDLLIESKEEEYFGQN